MSVTPYELRSFGGAAKATTLAADISAAATSLTVATGDGANYPDGSNGPGWITLDKGTNSEEKVYYTTRSGDTFSGLTRGADGTTATSHSGGTGTVAMTWSATDAAEANKAAHYTVGKITALGSLLVGAAANQLKELVLGSARQVLRTNAAGTDLEFATLSGRVSRDFFIQGQAVASTVDGDSGMFEVSIPTGQTVTLVGVKAFAVGTSHSGFTFKLRRYTSSAWADITNFGTTASPLSDSATVTGQSVSLADGDILGLYVVGAGSNYKGVKVTVLMDRTI